MCGLVGVHIGGRGLAEVCPRFATSTHKKPSHQVSGTRPIIPTTGSGESLLATPENADVIAGQESPRAGVTNVRSVGELAGFE